MVSGTPDCNGNGIPDSCDIASGFDPDPEGDGIPNILSPDDCFVTESRQKPITKKRLAEWERIPMDDFHAHVPVEVARNFQRNRYLIDFDYIPDTVRDNILGAWTGRTKKDRSQLLNYFMEHRMKNMMEHIGEF